MVERITIDVQELYGESAKLEQIPEYISSVQERAGEGNEVVLTGPGPVWLYLKLGHALHGKALKLIYSSPVTGEVEIFNHNPY